MRRMRHILHLDPQGLIVYRWHARTVHVEGHFMADAAGLAAFSEYVRVHPQRYYTLLTDLSEEDFRPEQIPRLRGNERRTVIERRLLRHFRNCPYTLALSQGYEKSRRQEERLLLAALTAPEKIHPWLSILEGAEIVLRAIHSQALLAPVLLKHLSGTGSTALLLVIQGSSLRQSYLEKGQLCFSRRSPITGDDHERAETVAIEAERIYQYLLNQQILDHDQPLHAVVIAEAAAIDALREHCTDGPTLAFEFQSANALPARLGYAPGNQADSFCAAACVHLLATEPPHHQFAGPEIRYRHRLQRTRSAITAGTVLVALSCVLLAGQQWIKRHELEDKADLVRKEITASRQHWLAAAQEQAELPASPATLQAIHQRQQAILQQSPLPAAFFSELSQLLNRFSSIEIDRLEWKVVTDIGTGPSTKTPAEIIHLHGRLPAPAALTPLPGEQSPAHSLQQFVSALDSAALQAVNLGRSPALTPAGHETAKGSSAIREQAFVLEIMKRGSP